MLCVACDTFDMHHALRLTLPIELHERPRHLAHDDRQIALPQLGTGLVGAVGVAVDALPGAVQLGTVGVEAAWLDARRRVAALAGEATLEAFDASVGETLKTVNNRYGELFAGEEALSSSAGSLVFTGVEDDPETLLTLERMGFSEPARVSQTIRAWHHGRIPATRTERGRELFTRLGPKLLEALSATGVPDAATKNVWLSGDVSMPLLPAISVPASGRKPVLPGSHISTVPVGRWANSSSNVLPGIISTVATMAPSVNAATLLAASLSGMRTQPIHETVGASSCMAMENTSIDSRPPWLVA